LGDTALFGEKRWPGGKHEKSSDESIRYLSTLKNLFFVAWKDGMFVKLMLVRSPRISGFALSIKSIFMNLFHLISAVQHLRESRSLPDSDPVDLSKRCLKRCEVVVTCIKNVIPLLEEAFAVDPKEGNLIYLST